LSIVGKFELSSALAAIAKLRPFFLAEVELLHHHFHIGVH